MARQTFTKQIGEHTYEVEQLHLVEAKKVGLLLSKKLGPGLAKILAASATLKDVTSGLDSMGTKAMSEGIVQLIQDIDDKSLDTIAEAFGKSSKILFDDGRAPIMTMQVQNNHFHGGNLSEFFMWIAFCVEVNFKDFLSVLGMKKVE